MRFAILIAAFGIVTGVPALAPSLSSAAHAQAQVDAPLTAEEQALQAQIVALAQSGNTAGLNSLIQQQVRAGRGASLAKIAKRVGVMAQSLAAADSQTAAALVNAAVIVASNPSVAAADSSVSTDVGANAASVVNAIQQNDPMSAASVQTSVAVNGNVAMQTAYASPPTTTTTTTTTTTPTPTIQRPVVRRTPVIPPSEPVIPVVPEPNPEQSGSPV